MLQDYDAEIVGSTDYLEKESYVTAALAQQYASMEGSEAVKRLKSPSRKYKWRTKQDPQKPEVIRYSPARATKSSGEQNSAGQLGKNQ